MGVASMGVACSNVRGEAWGWQRTWGSMGVGQHGVGVGQQGGGVAWEWGRMGVGQHGDRSSGPWVAWGWGSMGVG